MIPLILTGTLALGVGSAAGAGYLRRRWRRQAVGPLRAAAAGVTMLLLCLFSGVGFLATGVLGYYYYRPHPTNLSMVLYEGVHYERVAQREPFPLVYHVVRIRLDSPGLSFFVTPPELDGEFELRAQTTTQFLEKHRLQLAVNGNFFYPSHANNPWDYYPVSGEPVAVLGEAASSGDHYSTRATHYIPVSITDDNRVLFDEAEAGYNVIAGKPIELSETSDNPAQQTQRFPRTVFALDAGTNTLILLVVDGRQPNYSEGLSMVELRALLHDLGADQAINLDGGGSSTLVARMPGGRSRVLNSPIHTRIPGRERPVANHLGVYAAPLDAANNIPEMR